MSINLKINIVVWSLICSLGFLSCTAPQELLKLEEPKNVTTHFGPEDFVVDSSNNQLRLLISCDERRDQLSQGEIWEMDLGTEIPRKLELVFNSDHIAFHPHGISQFEDYLFVINHITDKREEVIKFKIYSDSLVQVAAYRDGFIGWGNNIFAVSADEFYYTNFKLLGGSVIHYVDGAFEKTFGRLRLPNGILIFEEKLYVSEIVGNRLIKYDLKSGKREKLARLKGGDNIMINGDVLFITAHSNFRQFLKHFKSNENLAPSVVYQYELKTDKLTIIYAEDGAVIPACATAIVIEGQLYLSQVLGNYITIFPLVK